MAYSDTNIGEVVTAVRDRLRTALSADAGQCYISLSNTPPDQQGGVVYRVHGRDGSVDSQKWDGGGRSQTTVDAIIEVQVWNRTELDEYDHADAMVADTALGIYSRIDAVLDVLNTHVLPKTGGDYILRDYGIEPLGFSGPDEVDGWAMATMRFRVLFDWKFS